MSQSLLWHILPDYPFPWFLEITLFRIAVSIINNAVLANWGHCKCRSSRNEDTCHHSICIYEENVNHVFLFEIWSNISCIVKIFLYIHSFSTNAVIINDDNSIDIYGIKYISQTNAAVNITFSLWHWVKTVLKWFLQMLRVNVSIWLNLHYIYPLSSCYRCQILGWCTWYISNCSRTYGLMYNPSGSSPPK